MSRIQKSRQSNAVRTHLIRFGSVLLVVLCIPLFTGLGVLGCGGEDDQVNNSMPTMRTQLDAPATQQLSTSLSDEASLGDLRGVTRLEIQFRRDPFQRSFPDMESRLNMDDPLELPPEPEVHHSRLAEYPIDSLQLVGVLTRTARPVAMFRVPDGSGLDELAYINDAVGPNGLGRIEDIQANMVTVVYQGFGAADQVQTRRVEVRLRAPEDDVEVTFE